MVQWRFRNHARVSDCGRQNDFARILIRRHDIINMYAESMTYLLGANDADRSAPRLL